MRLALPISFALTIIIASASGCASGAAETEAQSGSEQALTAAADLLKIAGRVAWADKGELKGPSRGRLVAKDIDRDGAAGFHAYRTTWGDDAVPSYDVVADFEPVLVIKVKDGPKCTSLTVGTKRNDGKFEITHAMPNLGSIDGPVLGDSNEFEHEVFISSRANLEASSDPHRAAKAVTNGSYEIAGDNLE